jgi:ribose transport system substrate-binding protein
MRFLDRDEQPVLFAVTISVASGLTLAMILGAVGVATRAGLLTWRVPMWSLIAVVAVMMCLAVVVVTGRRSATRRVFLIISAFSQKHWISELMHNTHRSLDRRGTELVLKIPDKDYSAAGQMHHLRGILSRREEYVGGLIIPVEVERTRRDLLRFCAKFPKPVVMVDVEPFDDERDYPRNAAFVGYDSVGIGQCAADWVVDHLERTGEHEPVVLVIGGPTQRGRQLRFVEIIEKKYPKARLIVHDNGEFARMRARRVVQDCLRNLPDEGRKPTVIFCASDELALGAVDGLLACGLTSATVVGVDGTSEAKALIDTRQSPLCATVVQDSYRVSETAVDLLERMIKGESVPLRTLLQAEIYVASGAT